MAISQQELERRTAAAQKRLEERKKAKALTSIADPLKAQEALKASNLTNISNTTKPIGDPYAIAVNKALDRANQKKTPILSQAQQDRQANATEDAESQRKIKAKEQDIRNQKIIKEIELGLREGRVAIDNNEFLEDGVTPNLNFGKKTILGAKEGQGTASSQEEEVRLFKKSQKEEKTAFETKIEELNSLDQDKLREDINVGRAAVSSSTAQLSPSREGIVSATNPLVAKEFKSRVNSQIDRSKRQLEMTMTSRAKLLKDLEKAQATGNAKAAETISLQLGQAENAIDKIQLDLANQQADNTKEAFGIVGKLPAGALQDLTIDEIAGSLDVDIATASVMKSIDKQKAELQLTDPDYLLKKAQIDKTTKESAVAGLTVNQKNFLTYQELLKTDPEQAKKFAVGAGFDNSPSALQAAQTAKINAELAQNNYNATGTSAPVDGDYEYKVGNNEVIFTGLVANTVANPTRWECGEVVNDALGKNIFGNSFANKKSKVNSKVPIAGGAFVERITDKFGNETAYGHVGLVERVYSDGSFDIKDSNYRKNSDGKGIISTDHIKKGSARWKSIVEQGGFYDGGLGNSDRQLEIQATQAQLKSGRLTNTETTKLRNVAKQQGWLKEYSEIISSPKTKGISSNQADKFNVDEGISQFELDDIIKARQEEGGGNRLFQSFTDEKSRKQLTDLKLLGERINEIKDIKKQLNDLGGETGPVGLRGFQAGIEKTPILGAIIPAQTDELELFQKLQALTGENLANYVKEISGAAVSEEEFQRLKQNKPNVEMLDSQFDNELDRMEKEYKTLIDTQVNRFEFDSQEQMNAAISGRPVKQGIDYNKIYEDSAKQPAKDFYDNL